MPDQRTRALNKIRQDGAFDALVVGGGVNGIGVFRDLALQGLRVLLVERNDFASGCSAAPSRMIHGGLRYLENGEFTLVRESLRERDILLKLAPHMVRPLPTVIPITSCLSGLWNGAASFLGASRKPARRGALPIKIGLELYDWVTRKGRVLPRHRFLTSWEMRDRWPDFLPAARRAAIYSDAWISHPERLCIEMLRDTEVTAPDAVAVNYAEVIVSDGTFTLVAGDERLRVEPRTVVNATGAWLDDTASALGGGDGQRLVAGTKGSHLILDNARLFDALDGHMVYFENGDGRICIVFPYLGRVLAGATDIRVDRAGRVRCEPEECDYILGALRQVFPSIEIGPEDVVFSYSGIRPLPRSDHRFTGRISRDHEVRRIEGRVPQFAMIGGKWTTFRAFAEDATDAVLSELKRSRTRSTRDLPIGGGAGFPSDPFALVGRIVEARGIDADRAALLFDLFGAKAEEVAVAGMDSPPLPGSSLTEGDIRWMIRHEFVVRLSDIVLRRTPLAIAGSISTELIEAIARILATERSLSCDAAGAEMAELFAELNDYHGVTPQMLAMRNTNGG
ncbi:glycerol-3-phosphate dehydrogenase/oxidase [Silicimonas algicola]|uniref:Glycerol-3-phosphate dehydrogenase n=1 Tax=Silicimonas algicola TaxID=1826607 RepID=A0A316G3L1_9RHOB|nr:glycerol-3-phosphate dehydrogenase/oxidase [Silicimonas algicola]AZQ67086.1 glycerol-3-phosphate dehydrogenase/oxidase [Silicimonas algicola]PWK55388.1 glycerol-3-phosphate dehydrogenase [Silicimonas algicola]